METTITLVGLAVSIGQEHSVWTLGADTAPAWCEAIRRILDTDRLVRPEAAQLAGRIGFLNSTVFGKLGRALIRPIIWRQLQSYGPYSLTRRLRCPYVRSKANRADAPSRQCFHDRKHMGARLVEFDFDRLHTTAERWVGLPCREALT